MKSYDNLVGLILAVIVTGLPDLRTRRPREALMSQNVIDVIVLVVLLAISTPLLGSYMAKVFQNKKAPGDRVFGPVERLVYRVTGVHPESEQRWTTYALSVLAFSLVSVLVLYGMQRLQAHLPLNPDHLASVAPALSFNTAVSFLTNTNWQNYAGEDTMSQFTQMTGLAVQNFVSAAVGIAVAVALIRGLTRRQSNTLGNFWADLTRIVIRILIPIAAVAAVDPDRPGSGAEPARHPHAHHRHRTVPGDPRRPGGLPGGDQAAGDERWRSLQRQRRPSLREPDRSDQHAVELAAARHPVRPGVDVRQDGQGPQAGLRRPRRHGRPVRHRRPPGHAARGPRERPRDPGTRLPGDHVHVARRQHGGQGGP